METEHPKQNERQLYAQLESSFDSAAVVITELAQEIVKLTEKYGTDSKITKTKNEQFARLTHFYDTALEYINHLRENNRAMGEEFMRQELEELHERSGMPYVEIAKMLNYPNPESWEMVDKLDDIIARAHAVLKKAPTTYLERFIERNRVQDAK